MRKYFVFDCETGGVREDKDSLLSLAGVLLDYNLNEIDSINLFIKPDDGRYKVTARAMEINNIYLVEHNKKAIPITQAADELQNFLCTHTVMGKLIPVGHNVDFDIRFTRYHLFPEPETDVPGQFLNKRHTWDNLFTKRSLDTASTARFLQLTGFLPNEDELDCSLRSLAEFFGLLDNPTNLHNAEYDARLTCNVLRKLKQLAEEL